MYCTRARHLWQRKTTTISVIGLLSLHHCNKVQRLPDGRLPTHQNLYNHLHKSGTSALKKQKINITLDPDLIAWFKARAGGRGYQTLINAALREAMDRASLEETLRRIIREEMQPAQTPRPPDEKVHP